MASDKTIELPILGTLPEGWKATPLEDLLAEPTRNGVYKPKPFHGGGTKMINMGELFAFPRLGQPPMKRVRLDESELARFTVRDGDLLFARRSLVAEGAGKCSIVVGGGEPRAFESSIIRARPDRRKAKSAFLYYVFQSPYGRYVLSTILRHVAVAGVTGTDLVKLEVPCPPLSEQHAIAAILGSLDDKIELNRRMNQTLEAMAQALFKSWFVDFDPVRAKAEGRQPAGMDAETAALFPDSFEDTPLGEIPRGWSVKPLDEIGVFVNGLALQNYPPTDCKSLPVIKIAELRRGVTESTDRASADIDPKYIVNNGDILFSWSGSLEVVVWTGGPGALNQHLFKVSSETYPKWYYHRWTLFHLPEFQAIAAGKATTMGHIQRRHLSGALAAVPPAPLLASMSRYMAPLLDVSVSNAMESRTLAAIRDALLPKLLSGEIRVKEAETMAGAALCQSRMV